MKKTTTRKEQEPKLKLKKETLRKQEVDAQDLKNVVGGQDRLAPDESLDCIK